MFYETNIFIQLQQKNISIQQVNNVCKTLFKMLFLGRYAALNMLFPGF